MFDIVPGFKVAHGKNTCLDPEETGHKDLRILKFLTWDHPSDLITLVKTNLFLNAVPQVYFSGIMKKHITHNIACNKYGVLFPGGLLEATILG